MTKAIPFGAGWLVCLTAALALTGGLAEAQRGGGFGRDPLSPEQTKKATELEARTVVEALELDEATAAKLTEAYQKARVSYAVGMPERQPGGGPGQFQALREHADTERGKLKEALAAFLSEEQVDAAIGTLGTFNRQWDRLVLTLDGFELAEANMSKALAHVAAYVKASDEARDSAMASGDFSAVRQVMQEEQSKLDTALASVLSEAQQAEWTEKTAPPQRGGRGGGPGGRRSN